MPHRPLTNSACTRERKHSASLVSLVPLPDSIFPLQWERPTNLYFQISPVLVMLSIYFTCDFSLYLNEVCIASMAWPHWRRGIKQSLNWNDHQFSNMNQVIQQWSISALSVIFYAFTDHDQTKHLTDLNSQDTTDCTWVIAAWLGPEMNSSRSARRFVMAYANTSSVSMKVSRAFLRAICRYFTSSSQLSVSHTSTHNYISTSAQNVICCRYWNMRIVYTCLNRALARSTWILSNFNLRRFPPTQSIRGEIYNICEQKCRLFSKKHVDTSIIKTVARYGSLSIRRTEMTRLLLLLLNFQS